MFTDATDHTSLKQGDVIKDVVFPIARPDTTRFISRMVSVAAGKVSVEVVSEGTDKRPYHLVQVQGGCHTCAVLSQCCDVDPHQNPPPQSFVLCKVVPVPKGIKKHQQSYDALRANLDPYGDRRTFIQNFWFGKVADSAEEYMADFGQVMTVSWSDYDHVLKNKLTELDDLNRAMFRVKVGAHFGRVAEEDKAAGFEDPYDRDDAPIPPRIPYAEKFKQAMRLLAGRDS
jgi:hypothetical protein